MKAAIWWTSPESKYKAEEKFDQIVENYKFCNIDPIRLTVAKERREVWFPNGDVWYCLAPLTNVRGLKVNLSYIPNEAYGQVKEIAQCCTVSLPFNGVIYY